MSELSKKYEDILSELKNNIVNEEEYELVKNKISELTMVYLNSLDKILDFKESYDNINLKLNKIDKRVTDIESDIYMDDSEQSEEDDYEFSIKCPYCGYEFITDNSFQNKSEIKCPKCHKIIELDWDDDVCNGNCDICNLQCGSNEKNMIHNDNKKNESTEMSVKESSTKYDTNKKDDKNNNTDNKNMNKTDSNNQKNNDDDM